jgi:hypothetical protein
MFYGQKVIELLKSVPLRPYKFYPFFAQSGFWVILLLHQASDSEKLPEVGEPVLNNIDCRAACPVAGLLAMTL